MAPRDFSTRLTRRAAKVGLFLNDDLVEKLTTFHALLARWNHPSRGFVPPDVFIALEDPPGWLETLGDVLPLKPFVQSFQDAFNPSVPAPAFLESRTSTSWEKETSTQLSSSVAPL